MVQVVLAKVVLGQVRNVGELHVRDIIWPQHADIHFCPPCLFLLLALLLILWGMGRAESGLWLGEIVVLNTDIAG